MMDEVVSVDEPHAYSPAESYVAHITSVKGKQTLLGTLANELKFPEYFGYNWDALYDCLRDFYRIEQQQIILVHDDLPELTTTELAIYIQLLVECTLDWSAGDVHSLTVVFPEKFKGLVLSLAKEE